MAEESVETGEIASREIEQLGRDSFFVSAGPVSQKLRTQVQLLAEAEVPVLILGEAGSGKSTVARLIHKWSIRSGFRFLKVNCADMPAELIEAELFRNLLAGDGQNGAGKCEPRQQWDYPFRRNYRDATQHSEQADADSAE